MASVVIPVVYLFVVFGGLFIFSFFYRKRNAAKQYDVYFKSHPERDTYVTLLQQADPPAHEAVLKAALVRRAVADVGRALRIREDKPALQNLLQKGSIGDDLWNSLLAAEKELEGEVREVVAEANTFVEGWGAIIFPTANEIIANEKMRQTFEQFTKLRAEKELAYGAKGKNLSKIPLPSFSVGPPPPGTPNGPPPALNLPGMPMPGTPGGPPPFPGAPSSGPAAPATPSLAAIKAANGLHPPPSAGTESITSQSDNESTRSGSTPRTPKSAKNKKRK